MAIHYRLICSIFLTICYTSNAVVFDEQVDKGGIQYCNGTAKEEGASRGTLTLPTQRNGTNCVWTLPNMKATYFYVESWTLDANDFVNISTSKYSLFNITGSLGAGFLMSKDLGNTSVTVSLTLSASTTAARMFRVQFNGIDSNQPITVNEPVRLQMPLVPTKDAGQFDLTLQLDSTLNSDSRVCLWLLDYPKDPLLRFNYSRVVFASSADTLTIQNGLNGDLSPVVAQYGKDNLVDDQNNLGKLLLGSHARISYVSGYINKEAQENILQVSYELVQNGGVYYGPNDTQQLTITGENANNLYNNFAFVTGVDVLAAFVIDGKDTPAGSDFEVYNTLDLSAKPLFVVKQSKLLPSMLVSDTNVLRFRVNSTALVFKGKFTSNMNKNYVTLTKTDDVINVNDLACSTNSVAFIPARPVGTFTFALTKLVLASDGDCVYLNQLTDTKQNLITYCYDKNEPMVRQSVLPHVVVPAENAYSVEYSRGKDCKKLDMPLFQISMAYSPQFDCNYVINLADSVNSTMVPSSYPGLYPLVHADLYKTTQVDNKCGYLAQNPGSLVYTVFEDLELLGSQELLLNTPTTTLPFSNKSMGLPGDILASNLTFIKVNSTLNYNTKFDSKNGLSGRGFKVRLISAHCGEQVDASAVSMLETPGYPNKTSSAITKCMWILNVGKPEAKTHPVINFTVNYDKTAADLVVYDNPTIRDENRFVYLNESVANTFSSSLDTVVVVLTIKDPKKGASFQMNWNVTTCEKYYPGEVPRTCLNTDRCILPHWVCNNRTECGDYSDEYHCNGSLPIPPTPDCPKSSSGGGWVIVLVIIPMAIAVGVVLTMFGPMLIDRFRNGRYQEFRDFSEVS
ncbi:hypothetical protein HDE_08526 [Halotydeus destructor]|nr:hypothetical protein HDE_08526 [Halotydeus destructor]